jgi:hypothetical protein
MRALAVPTESISAKMRRSAACNLYRAIRDLVAAIPGIGSSNPVVAKFCRATAVAKRCLSGLGRKCSMHLYSAERRRRDHLRR